MKLFKINTLRPEKEKIELAAKIIQNNGLVVYPTDTLYGIGTNALSESAVRKVFKTKGRAFNKPILIALSSINEAKKYVKFNSISLKLAKKFLPGPLTLILPLKKKFPKLLTKGENKIGIRIPDNRVAIELIKSCKVPITSTSANISGEKNPINAKEAMKQIGNKVDLILDSGRCKYKKPSTIIDATSGKIIIIREGIIKKEKVLL